MNSLVRNFVRLGFGMALLVAMTHQVQAQKFAFVDTEYIMENVPEYEDAKAEMDALAEKWQKEIEGMFQEVEQLYKSYQADAVLLPDDMKKKREEDIIQQEKEAKALQQKRFGPGGDLDLKRQELIKPLQEKLYNAMEEVAVDGNYAVIFDKSSGGNMLYTNAKFDLSEEVLDKMGYAH